MLCSVMYVMYGSAMSCHVYDVTYSNGKECNVQ